MGSSNVSLVPFLFLIEEKCMASPFDTEEKTYYSKKEMMKIFRVTHMTIENWYRAGYIERVQSTPKKIFFSLPKIVRSTLSDTENQNFINNTSSNKIKDLLESERFYSSSELARMYGTIVQRVADWRNFGLIEFVECPKYMYWHRLPSHLPNPQNLEKENENDDTTQK